MVFAALPPPRRRRCGEPRRSSEASEERRRERAARRAMSTDPQQRLNEIRDAVRHHEERYYIHNAPEISDEEFDRLLHELERLEAEHPDLVTADSPTQRVGGRAVEGFATVEHVVPMLSLDNAYNDEELRAFDERVRRGAGIGEQPV